MDNAQLEQIILNPKIEQADNNKRQQKGDRFKTENIDIMIWKIYFATIFYINLQRLNKASESIQVKKLSSLYDNPEESKADDVKRDNGKQENNGDLFIAGIACFGNEWNN